MRRIDLTQKEKRMVDSALRFWLSRPKSQENEALKVRDETMKKKKNKETFMNSRMNALRAYEEKFETDFFVEEMEHLEGIITLVRLIDMEQPDDHSPRLFPKDAINKLYAIWEGLAEEMTRRMKAKRIEPIHQDLKTRGEEKEAEPCSGVFIIRD